MTRESTDTTPAIAVTDAPFEVGHAPVEVALTPATDGTERLLTQVHSGGRLLLHLSDVRRPGRSGSYDVYVNLPPDGQPGDHPDHFAGRISLYGSASRGEPPVFDFVLDLSRLRAIVATASGLVDRFRVTVVPVNDWSQPVTVGRVSLHRG